MSVLNYQKNTNAQTVFLCIIVLLTYSAFIILTSTVLETNQ